MHDLVHFFSTAPFEMCFFYRGKEVKHFIVKAKKGGCFYFTIDKS